MRREQLTFFEAPVSIPPVTYRVAGGIPSFEELPLGSPVRVALVDDAGVIVATAPGFVSSSATRERSARRNARWVERWHTVSVA